MKLGRRLIPYLTAALALGALGACTNEGLDSTDGDEAGDSLVAGATLVVSAAPNRQSPVPLEGAVVKGDAYVFVTSTPQLKQVRFWVDNATPSSPTGAPTQTENVAPFDCAGTAPDTTAQPLKLKPGVHTVSAQATLQDGRVQSIGTARFTVADPAAGGIKWHPGHYIYTSNPVSKPGEVDKALASPFITGVMIRVMWNRDNLEPRKGQYDFSMIASVLARYQAKGKRLQILWMDQDYWGNDCVPQYLRDPAHPDYDPAYKGGQVKSGNRCVPKYWVPAVMDRLIAANAALGARFDKEAYFESFSTAETAAPCLGDPECSPGVQAEQFIRQHNALPAAFPHTLAFVHGNWTPSTDRVTANMYAKGLGLDGPDLTVIGPKDPSQGPSWGYTCYNSVFVSSGGCKTDYYQKIPLGIGGQVGLERSIQDGYTMAEIFDFAITSPKGLRVSHMAWSQPYQTPGFSFNGTILPYVESKRGTIMNTVCPENLVKFRGGCRTN